MFGRFIGLNPNPEPPGSCLKIKPENLEVVTVYTQRPRSLGAPDIHARYLALGGVPS